MRYTIPRKACHSARIATPFDRWVKAAASKQARALSIEQHTGAVDSELVDLQLALRWRTTQLQLWRQVQSTFSCSDTYHRALMDAKQSCVFVQADMFGGLCNLPSRRAPIDEAGALPQAFGHTVKTATVVRLRSASSHPLAQSVTVRSQRALTQGGRRLVLLPPRRQLIPPRQKATQLQSNQL